MDISVDPGYKSYSRNAYAVIHGLCQAPINIKLEGLNPYGSIKLTPALELIEDLERSNKIGRGSTIIESSSGNLGVALSAVCANKNYRFICVTDPNASPHSIALMKAFGAEIIVVQQKDTVGGYLASRIDLINKMCTEDDSLIWINQYANKNNWLSHYRNTAADISKEFKHVDWLFIGAGTTGTLMGCSKYFRKFHQNTKIIAVDATGSVTFKAPPAPRHIPGLGTSRRPEILEESIVDEVVHIDEISTVRMCKRVAKKGLLIGGSTGTVLAAIEKYASKILPTDIVVTISPDLGDKYLTTIYNDKWVEDKLFYYVDSEIKVNIEELV